MSGRGMLGLVMVLGLVVPLATAQERGRGGSRSPERRQEAFRMVDAYVIANIQDSLGLTDAQYEKVVPLVSKLQRARREYHHRRSQALRDMRRLLSSGVATEAEVEAALEAYRAIENEGPTEARTYMKALDAVLSPVQQAKFRIFEMEVESRMRRLMRRGRGDRPPSGERP